MSSGGTAKKTSTKKSSMQILFILFHYLSLLNNFGCGSIVILKIACFLGAYAAFCEGDHY
jgi:hypothetical protein